MNRREALELLKRHVQTKNLIKHSLAVEAVMGAMAEHFNEDVEIWSLAGLLHDLDYDYTKNHPELHGLKSVELLADFSLPQDIIDAILAHCDKKNREKLIEKVIYAVDPATGFIVAAALIKPEKSLSSIDVRFLLRRFSEKLFAKGASREQMRTCESFGLPLEDFLSISLQAMQKISADLGL